MNLFQLVFKQMRQRALSTWLTLFSVLLGVGLATTTLIAQRSGNALFGQSDFGYDLLIGPKGSKLQLVLSTVYHLGDSQGTIPYALYENLEKSLPPHLRRAIQWKVPFAIGDYYEGHRIVGTTTSLFGLDEQAQPLPENRVPEYRRNRRFELAEGRVFHSRKFEAVIGADVAARTGLKLNSTFQAEHGTGGAHKDEHCEEWTVVGILKKTHTANDAVLFIPLVSFYAIPDHSEGLRQMAQAAGQKVPEPDEHRDDHEHGHHHPYELDENGLIDLETPPEQWRLSAIIASTPPRSVLGTMVMWFINNGQEGAMAVNPATEMAQFFTTFLKAGATVLLAISVLVCIVAAVSILVSIYNSVTARRKEIAILRALGATRNRILALICLEAGLIGLLGGIAGVFIGHLIGAVGSVYLRQLLGEGVQWLTFDPLEGLYLGAVVVLAVLAGLVPALKAYETPVATHLAAT